MFGLDWDCVKQHLALMDVVIGRPPSEYMVRHVQVTHGIFDLFIKALRLTIATVPNSNTKGDNAGYRRRAIAEPM